jgi:hypothetical protein
LADTASDTGYDQALQHQREPPQGARGYDAAVGLAFRERQHVAAILEQRGEAGLEAQLPRTELGQMHHQSHGRVALRAREALDFGDESRVGELAGSS